MMLFELYEVLFWIASIY